MEWYQLKVAVSTAMGVSQDALHIFTGVGLQILLALILRLRLSNLLPWSTVLGLEILNEYSDLRADIWPNRAIQYGESLKDVGVTMVIPTLLLLLVAFAPRLFVARPLSPASEVADPGLAKPTQSGDT
jgi:hypothetical protein